MDLHVFPIPIPPPTSLYPIPLGLPSAPGPSTCLMVLLLFASKVKKNMHLLLAVDSAVLAVIFSVSLPLASQYIWL